MDKTKLMWKIVWGVLIVLFLRNCFKSNRDTTYVSPSASTPTSAPTKEVDFDKLKKDLTQVFDEFEKEVNQIQYDSYKANATQLYTELGFSEDEIRSAFEEIEATNFYKERMGNSSSQASSAEPLAEGSNMTKSEVEKARYARTRVAWKAHTLTQEQRTEWLGEAALNGLPDEYYRPTMSKEYFLEYFAHCLNSDGMFELEMYDMSYEDFVSSGIIIAHSNE